MMYDLVIIGGGPAGVAAGVYAARKRLRTLIITFEWGGQSSVSEEIQNWIGTIRISGEDLAKNLKEHLFAYKSDVVDIKEHDKVDKIEKIESGFRVHTESGELFETKTVLVGTGSHRRKLNIPGAQQFEHKGITYCASCDGPMFSGKDVVVIGGGNAGFESAAQLLAYANSVTLIQRSKEYRADETTLSRILSHPKMRGLTNTELIEVKGGQFVTSLVYKDLNNGEIKEIPCQGIFVEIGSVPSTEFLKGIVELNQNNQVIVDPRTQATKTEGIWAAGDCTDTLYHQNSIALGDGVRALENIYMYLHAR